MNPIVFDDRNTPGTLAMLEVGPLRLEMSWCPAGVFRMGSGCHEWETPHRVVITRGFWIGIVPVTRREFRKVLPHHSVNWLMEPDDASPVEPLSWEAADEFCGVLTEWMAQSRQRVSLPTEAQWEYAARAGTETLWYFGGDERNLDRHAWYSANSGGVTHSVRLKEANPWGLFDVYGNVLEWCLDDFRSFIGEPEIDPVYPRGTGLKIARGGNCHAHPIDCRSAARRAILPRNPDVEEIGFRVVCVQEARRQRHAGQ